MTSAAVSSTTSALVIAEHDNTTLKAATLHALTAALQCGGPVHLLVAGHHWQRDCHRALGRRRQGIQSHRRH
ncbi:MAG: hypothetical protein ABW202_13485 [Duganella sp.]